MTVDDLDTSGAPRVTYAVLAHSRQAQLSRLLRVLRTESPSCAVVLHWDGSRSRLDRRALEGVDNVVVVEDWVSVQWGDYSIVEATLRTLRVALEHTDSDWIVLLSGQDYPIAPLAEIETTLWHSGCDAFMDPGRVASGARTFRWRRGEGSRLGRRYFFTYRRIPEVSVPLPGIVRSAAIRALFILAEYQPLVSIWPMPAGVPSRIGVRSRRTPFGPRRPCRVGSAWMSLSRRCAERVLVRLEEEPELENHYRRTIIPDESLFQTVICAEQDLEVSPDNKRYQQWGVGASPLHPEILGVDGVDAALRSGKHFARKLDEDADSEALDRIDSQRRARQ